MSNTLIYQCRSNKMDVLFVDRHRNIVAFIKAHAFRNISESPTQKRTTILSRAYWPKIKFQQVWS